MNKRVYVTIDYENFKKNIMINYMQEYDDKLYFRYLKKQVEGTNILKVKNEKTKYHSSKTFQ